MRKLLVLSVAALVAQPALALDDRSAARIVRNYSEAIACQIEYTDYKALEIQSGDPESNGLGAVYVVYWQGDIGCAGGNGTITQNFSVVEHRGFMSADPVVVTDYDFPELNLVAVTDLSVNQGLLRIEGLQYSANDHKLNPSQRVVYRVKYNGESFVID